MRCMSSSVSLFRPSESGLPQSRENMLKQTDENGRSWDNLCSRIILFGIPS